MNFERLACTCALFLVASQSPCIAGGVSDRPHARADVAASVPSITSDSVAATVADKRNPFKSERCSKPSPASLAALSDYLATTEGIRLRWTKPDGSDASAIVRRQANGKVHVMTALVDRSGGGAENINWLTDVQLIGETSQWNLLSVSSRRLQKGAFISGDPTDSDWRHLWSEIVGALSRATNTCVE